MSFPPSRKPKSEESVFAKDGLTVMLLRKISISHLGGIKNFSWDFTNSLNVVEERYSDELFWAITAVLHNKSTPCMPPIWICKESRIDAVVSINEKTFHIRITPNEDLNEIKLSAFDKQAREETAEYRYLSSHCAEHDLSDIFDGNEDTMLLRFLQYANEDLYYAPCELAKQTEGISTLRAFRSYLRTFIKNFKGETIREGKHYEIVLKPNGRYAVKHRIDGDHPVLLSESEHTLFRYLCFLRTAEFWRGFEDIRNLHGIKKPLIIKDFLNRLDKSIDIKDLLKRTEELGRQVIILS